MEECREVGLRNERKGSATEENVQADPCREWQAQSSRITPEDGTMILVDVDADGAEEGSVASICG